MSEDVKVEIVGLEEFTTLAANPRLHNPKNIGMIADNIQENGFMRPIQADEGNTILAGNGTYDAAVQAGYRRAVVIDTEGDMVVIHRRKGLTETQKLRYAIEDNQATLTSSWDVDFLAQLARTDREALDGIFDDADVAAFLALAGAGDTPSEPTTEFKPDLDRPPRIQPGEIWQVGEHRIGCGDATDPAFVARLCDGLMLNGIFTSPPYAEQRADSYASTNTEDYPDWFATVAGCWEPHLCDDGSFFLNIKAHVEDGVRSLYVYKTVIRLVEGEGWRLVDEFCWKKQGYPGNYDNRFKNAWEPVYHFVRQRKFKARVKNVAEARSSKVGAWYGPLAQAQGKGGTVTGRTVSSVQPDNVIEVGIDGTGIPTDQHPARFPVGLPAFFLQAFSDPGDVWADPFLGTGSTLIAAEQTMRRVVGCDLDPLYLETALQRAEYSGITNIFLLSSPGDPHAE